MPLNTSLLASLTVTSFIAHAVAVVVVFFLLSMTTKDVAAFVVKKTSILIVLALTVVIASFLTNFGLLTALQWNSCSAVKNVGAIVWNAAKPLLLVLGFAILPVQSEWLRLAISQITQFIPGMKPHLPLEMPKQVAINETVLTAGSKVLDIATGQESQPPFAPVKGEAGVLDEASFNRQNFWEMSFACSYMAAFGGAIAFAWGSWDVVKC
jgi:hypothetical protein